MRDRKKNKLAKEYLGGLRDFLEKFTSTPEFQGQSGGITGILENLVKKANTVQGNLIQTRVQEFEHILRQPMSSLKQRVNTLCWHKKEEINYEFLSCIVKQFEEYVGLHKRLYVDFAVIIAGKIGLDKLSNSTRKLYSEYRDDYNEFVVAYTRFAEESRKAKLGIFNEHLKKANAL